MIFSVKSLQAFAALALGGAVAMGCTNAPKGGVDDQGDATGDTSVDYSTEATGDVVANRELRMHRLGGTHPTSNVAGPVPDPWVGPGTNPAGPVPDPWQGGGGSDPNPPPNPNPNPDPDHDKDD